MCKVLPVRGKVSGWKGKEMKKRYSAWFNVKEEIKYLRMRHKCARCWACAGRLHLQRGDESCSFSRKKEANRC
jgi:hypothetical protein